MTGVSITWLMNFIKEEYKNQGKDLLNWLPQEQENKPNLVITCQADEVWSFVNSKKKAVDLVSNGRRESSNNSLSYWRKNH